MTDLALVRFYACEGDPVPVALRLLMKALDQKQRTWVQGTEDALQRLSDALWLQPGFQAHAGPSSPADVVSASPIVLGHQAAEVGERLGLWIGLCASGDVDALPAQRCFELVGPSESERQRGRQRYRAYQAAGYAPESVQVKAL